MLTTLGLLQGHLGDLLWLVTGAAETALRPVVGPWKALPCLVKGPEVVLLDVQA